MLFNSYEFLIFLPIVFLLYWFVFKPLKWQNLFIVIASYHSMDGGTGDFCS